MKNTYSKKEVVKLLAHLLESPDLLIDAVQNENTNYDAEALIEIAETSQITPASETPTSKDNLQVETAVVESIEQCRCGEFKPTCPTHGNATPTPQVESVEEVKTNLYQDIELLYDRINMHNDDEHGDFDKGLLCNYIVEILNKHQQSQPNTSALGEWIDVNERTPDESGRYWCYVAEQTDLGLSHYQWNCAYSKEDNRWSDKHQVNVTHWMPLPNPPAK